MHPLETIPEPVMVAAFLAGEMGSARFGPAMLAALQTRGLDRRLIDAPDLSDPDQNSLRAELLGELRGYRRNRLLFQGFPDEVTWHRYALAPADLERVRYLDYSYWNALSDGSRLPRKAAETVRAGREVFGQSSQGFWDAAQALVRGARFPELILVGTAAPGDLVVLEGNLRLTAYFLEPQLIPENLPAIVGLSPDLDRWMALS